MFGFRIVKDQPLTRMGILSTISSVYDLLGIAAPFLLVGKKILQDLCRTKLGWDDEVCKELHVRWEKWRGQLPVLQHFSKERCLNPITLAHSCRDRSTASLTQVRLVMVKYLTLECKRER